MTAGGRAACPKQKEHGLVIIHKNPFVCRSKQGFRKSNSVCFVHVMFICVDRQAEDCARQRPPGERYK